MADSAITKGASPLVLIVDDYADGREMCATMLAISGYRTAEATDGFGALTQVLALAPDCVLMDLALPGMDGWEVTRRLKADARTRDIPVIAVSGQPVTDEDAPTGSPGFAAIVTKPCTLESVLDAIAGVLGRRPAP